MENSAKILQTGFFKCQYEVLERRDWREARGEKRRTKISRNRNGF